MIKHNGILSRTGRAAALALVLISALLAGGCLVGNEEYDEARAQRDEYRSHLQRLHESNDLLKREISAIYESCDLISAQLTVLAAMAIHNQYTANLGRPILPPPIERDATPAATGRSGGSAVTTTRGQSGTRSPGGTGARSGSRTSGGSRGGSSGGTRTTPPPTPPANSGGGGGSIDWGL